MNQTLIKTDVIASVAPQSFTEYSFDIHITNSGFHEVKIVLTLRQVLLEKKRAQINLQYVSTHSGRDFCYSNTNKSTYFLE